MNRRSFFGWMIAGVAGWFGIGAVAVADERSKVQEWINQFQGGFGGIQTIEEYAEREFGKWSVLQGYRTITKDYTTGSFSGGSIAIWVVYSNLEMPDYVSLRRSLLRKFFASLDGVICEVSPRSVVCGVFGGQVEWKADLKAIEG